MTDVPQPTGLAAEWRDAQVLHRLYTALAREFVIETPACADLDAAVQVPSDEGILQARQWFSTMDERIQVHQLRQFLQTTALADSEGLRLLLLRHLRKAKHTASDRDKLDFLLVQFFSQAAPSRLEDVDCDLDYVAHVLEPVLGQVEIRVPDWLAPLEQVLQSANRCHRLNDLFNTHLLEQGRKLKVQSGENYFQPVAMVAFARFSFLMRRVFFRLMHNDLNAILDGLRDLENLGITTLDCRRAHFSHQEPADRLRMICHSWKVMFHAEYSTGQPLKMLADLRTVVEETLARATGRTAAPPAPAPPAPPPPAPVKAVSVKAAPAKAAAATAAPAKAAPAGPAQPKAHAATAKFKPSNSASPEFDVSTPHSEHDEGDVI
jgi:hypothetical protein